VTGPRSTSGDADPHGEGASSA
jgi:hypothetical protein